MSVIFAYGRSAESEDVLFIILVEKLSRHFEDEMNYSRYKVVELEMKQKRSLSSMLLLKRYFS